MFTLSNNKRRIFSCICLWRLSLMLLHPIRIITPVPDVGPSGSVINSNYFSVFAVKACIFPKNIVPLQQIFYYTMLLYPNCKVNMGLRVVRKRPDGYHDLETIFVPVYGLHDELEVVPAPSFAFTQEGITVDCAPEDNLIIKCYRHLAAKYPQIGPVSIRFKKNIPFGAGLGGGSSDAAHMAIALNELFGLRLNKAQLAAEVASLGADCPFFIYNTPCFAERIGVLKGDKNMKCDEEILIDLDTEDSNGDTRVVSGNKNPPGISLGGHAKFTYCVVDSKNMSSVNYDFAVLSLDYDYPSGTIKVGRHHDCEDSHNANSHKGNIYPNIVNNNATLFYCFVPKNSKAKQNYPFKNKNYGQDF